MRDINKEYTDFLKENIDFLIRSNSSYDNGYKSEAKRLSVIVRVLVHDTKDSTSLLKRLNKKNILFYDSSSDYRPNALNSFMGLILIGLENVTGYTGGYIPRLDNVRKLMKKIPFDEWWNNIILDDKKGNVLSRKKLILQVANKDGGAHIDPKLDKSYENITRNSSLGTFFKHEEGKVEEIASPVELACVRQISHELLKTLRDEFPDLF